MIWRPKHSVERRVFRPLDHNDQGLTEDTTMKSPQAHKVPGAVAIAISAARPEFLRAANPEAMSAEEVAGMFGMMADMIELGYAQSQKIVRLEKQVEGARYHLRDLATAARNTENLVISAIKDLADPTPIDDEDEG